MSPGRDDETGEARTDNLVLSIDKPGSDLVVRVGGRTLTQVDLDPLGEGGPGGGGMDVAGGVVQGVGKERMDRGGCGEVASVGVRVHVSRLR